MTEPANTPTLFTTPTDRPALDREVLATLHESNTPLDVDAIHEEVNSDKGRAHVAKGPLETLLGELAKAGKIAEVAHGQPARPHFVLVAEVREELDGTWVRAKALAAVVIAMGDPTNPITIQDITGTLGGSMMRANGALPIPLPYLSAIANCVDVNNPEAVDAMVAVQLDALVRNGLATMTAYDPGPTPAVDEIPTEPTDEATKTESTDSESALSDAAEEAPASPPAEPNLHASTFALTVMGWEKLVEEGALAVAIVAFPELAQQKNDSSANEARELKRQLDEVRREFDIHKEVSAKLNASLLDDNKKLRTEQSRFLLFCEEKGIDFALAANNALNERVRERHTIHGVLTVGRLSELIDEKTKAKRYAEALEERVKDQSTAGKANVKDAKARVEQLDGIIAMAGSGIGGEFTLEKMCIKYVQGGCIVWKSDEPHDQGRTVEVQPITGAEVTKMEDGKEKEKAKPTQLAIPGTAKPGELEWQPGDPPPVGSGEGEAVADPADATTPPTEGAAPEASPEPTEELERTTDEPTDDAADEEGDVPEDASDDGGEDEEEEDEEQNDEEGEDGDDSNSAPADSSSPPIIGGKPVPDAVSAKTFIRDHLKKGRATTSDVGTAYAESLGLGDKHRVVKFGTDIITQLVQAGELESETVGDSQFVWLKSESEAKPARGKRGRKST